jgi:hypothetical protein
MPAMPPGSCSSCSIFGVGQSQSSRITGLIDDEQDIVFVDELIVLDPSDDGSCCCSCC